MRPANPPPDPQLDRLRELYAAYEQARAAEHNAYQALAAHARHLHEQGLSLEAIASALGLYKARVQYWVRPVTQRPRITPDRKRPPTRGPKADRPD